MMAVTRIKNNQITDLTVNAASKLQDYSLTSSKIANNLTYGSDLTISGNLTVQGNVTAIDTHDLVVEDPLILLAREQTGAPTLDIGFIGKRGTEDNIAFVWDESEDQFVAVFTTSEVTNTTININSYASLQVLDLTAANLDISGNIEFEGNIVGNITVTGNLDADNINATNAVTAASANVTGNIDVGNVNSADLVTGVTITASGNLVGNNAVITNDVSANTGTFTGNVSADTFLGNIDGATGTFTGNVTADTFLGNIDGATGTFTGNVSADTFLGNIDGDTGTFTGNVDVANLNATTNITTTTITASGNIEGVTGIFTGNVSADTFLGNIEGGTGTFTGNVDMANSFVTGNVTAGNLVSTGAVIGNIDVTGNLNVENINASGDIIAANLTANTAVNANLISGTSVQIISSGDLDLQPTGNITVSGALIRDVADPELAQDAATKQYVDDAVSSGIHIHTPVLVETPVALPAATYAQGGNTFTVTDTVANSTVVFSTAANLQVNDSLWFANSFEGIVANVAYFVVSTPNTSAAVLSTQYNGAPVSNITSNSGLTESVRVNSGVGATLTATANAALVVDGVSVSGGDRVLVYQQSTAYENGVYVVTDAGNVSAPWILTRSSDTDTYIPDDSFGLDQGSYFYVQSGDTGAGESYVKTAPAGPFVFGFDSITFTQFSASQVYSANTQAGLVLNGTVFSAKVDNDTTAFDGGGNISVKAGANLVTPNIGDATGNSLTLTGNGLLSATTVDVSGNVTAGNLNANTSVTAITVTASGNLVGNNAVITNDVSTTTVTASGNVSAANVNATSDVTANGNINGNNAVIANDVSTTTVTASGNVSGVTFLGNIEGETGTFTGNVSGDTFLGNIDGATGTFTGNVSGVTFLGNVEGEYATFTGNVTANNFIGNISGNIDAGGANTEIQFNDDDILNGDANFTFDKSSGQVTISGSLVVDNVVVDGNDITSTDYELTINAVSNDVDFRVSGNTNSNLLFVDAGTDSVMIATNILTSGASFKVGTTDSMLPPVGNTIERPDPAVAGMLRFNTTEDTLEVYSSLDGWISLGAPDFSIVVADSFTGDGSTVTFTLSEDSTTASTIISINGVVQEPTTAYSVVGNVLTFTEAPESTDEIDARILTTTTEVVRIQNGSGNASVQVFDNSSNVEITGDLLPSSDLGGNLGADVQRWNDLYLAGNTIFLGDLQLKEINSTTFGVFQSDGVTAADLDVGNIDVAALSQGNSIIGIASTNGNAYITVNNTANVLVVTTAGADVTGAFTATGNVTGNYILGNGSQLTGIDATSIQNGTANVRTFENANVTVSAGGNANVGVFTAAGLVVTGSIEATNGFIGLDATAIANGTANVRTFQDANVAVSAGGTANVLLVTGTGANVTGTISATGNVVAGNLIVSGIESVGTLNVSGDTLISGNLTVSGTTITANVATLVVTDPILGLGRGANGAPLTSNDGLDRGTEMFYYTTAEQIAFMGFDNSEGKMLSASNVSVANNIVTVNSYGTTVVGTLEVGNIVNTNANGVGNIGSNTTFFNTVFAKATSAQYADLAEMYEADQIIESGTVVCFGGTKEVTVCDEDSCQRIAGVVSTNPSYIMNAGLAGDHVIAIALTGRVPCRVTGSVRKGDMMVAAGDGRARAEANPKIGSVIGKALADFDGVDGVIEVVVGRL